MRLGFLFDEEYSDRLMELSQYAERVPYELLKQAIDTMTNAYKLMEDNGHNQTTR